MSLATKKSSSSTTPLCSKVSSFAQRDGIRLRYLLDSECARRLRGQGDQSLFVVAQETLGFVARPIWGLALANAGQARQFTLWTIGILEEGLNVTSRAVLESLL